MGPHRADGAARSYLFVPATRLDRVDKALDTGCDVVIVDLEDAVADDDKDRVRHDLSELAPARPLHVRVNSLGTPFGRADLAMVSKAGWVDGVVLPMVGSAGDVRLARELLPAGMPVVGLVETAGGLVAVDEIAASGVSRLALGSADYSADLGAPPTEALLAYPRSRLAVASAAAGLAPPIDGPTLALDQPTQLRGEAAAAKALGMGGKLCIHPSQVAVVDAVFGPSDAEVSWARAILDAAGRPGGGVSVVNGEMVDAPVLARARRILEQ